MTAIIPPPFQNCTREGTLPGCLFKFDHPEEQCTQRRTGGLFFIKSSTNLVTLSVGFLCGKCPDGEGVDLTLRQCKKCTIGDAIAVTVIGMFTLLNTKSLILTKALSIKTVIAFFVASLLVLFYNVGIPNELKGCLFFIQVQHHQPTKA